MLLNYIYNSNNFFNEAEVDGQPPEEGQEPEDYTQGNEEETPPSDQQDQQQTQQEDQDQTSQQDDEQYQDEGEPVDYTQDGDNDYQDSGEGYDDNEEGQGAPSEEEEQPVNDLKAQEEELLNMNPEHLNIKHKELKNRYLDMYDMTTEIIDRIGDAIISEDNIAVIEYVSKSLSQLREMLTDYVDSVYQTKSYIENSINYNRFLAVLNGINKMLEEIHEKE